MYLLIMAAVSGLAQIYAAGHPTDEPKFLLGDVAAAADLTLPVLRTWVSREPKIIKLGPADIAPQGKGSAIIFTLRRVLNAAIIAELVCLGLTPAKASGYAYELTDAIQPTANDERKGYLDTPGSIIKLFPRDQGLTVISERKLEEISVRDILSGFERHQPASSAAILDYDVILSQVISKLKERGKLEASSNAGVQSRDG